MGLHLSVTHTHTQTHVMTPLSIWIAARPSFFLLISSFHRWRFWWFCAFGCDKTRFPLSRADFTKAMLQGVDSFFFVDKPSASLCLCLQRVSTVDHPSLSQWTCQRWGAARSLYGTPLCSGCIVGVVYSLPRVVYVLVLLVRAWRIQAQWAKLQIEVVLPHQWGRHLQ